MTVIEINHLHKRYGEKTAVDDISFAVDSGEIFGVLGPNGAGKTTTVECVEGLRRPDGGSVRVLGVNPRQDRARIRQQVGVQLQESQLPDKLTVYESLELYASFYPSSEPVLPLLERLGLAEKRNTRYKKLSGGQKQRLSIALALIGRPRIVVLDELTTGLDPAARRDTWALIQEMRNHGVTILLVTHFMEEAERLCDRVALIDNGRVVALGSPAALVDGLDAEQQLRFHPSIPFDGRLLLDLTEVDRVAWHGADVAVTGTDNLLTAVTTTLTAHGIIPQQLQLAQPNLEDVFVALTGRARTAADQKEAL